MERFGAVAVAAVCGRPRASAGSRFAGGDQVDTLGLLVAVLITAAAVDDGAAAPQLLAQVSPAEFPRRNSKDYERTIASSAAMIQVSQTHLMLRRLAPHEDRRFHYRARAA